MMNNSLHRNFSRFGMDFELKIWEIKVCFFDFREWIKIARNVLKIQEFAWRYENQFGILFMLATSSKSPRILNWSKDSRETDLNKLWSGRLIEILIANPSKLHFGQEVIYCDI
jgi:hypothetical protein